MKKEALDWQPSLAPPDSSSTLPSRRCENQWNPKTNQIPLIEALCKKTNICVVVEKTTPLTKRTSQQYVGQCPFHDEDTPSLFVSKSRRLFYCYGCKQGGNAFGFLIAMGKSRDEAISILAEHAKLPTPDQLPSPEISQSNPKQIDKLLIRGTVGAIRTMKTRKNISMAFFDLHGSRSKVECVVFPDVFEKFQLHLSATPTSMKKIVVLGNLETEIQKSMLTVADMI
ncbi:MAG: CHC2 zinc finger domain-containing protein [Bdellovibrionia bacterium]